MSPFRKWFLEFLGWKIYSPTPEGLEDCYTYIRIQHLKAWTIRTTPEYNAVKER